MNKLQKMMALSFAFVLLVTNFGGNAKSFAQESSNETMVSNTAQADSIDPASLVISIRGAKPEKSKRDPNMLSFSIPRKYENDKLKSLTHDEIVVAPGYKAQLLDFAEQKEIKELILAGSETGFYAYLRLQNGKDKDITIPINLGFTIDYRVSRILGISLNEDEAPTTGKSKEDRRVLSITLPDNSDKVSIDQRDIVTDSQGVKPSKVEFYGKDATFKTEEKNPIPLEEGKITTIYFKLVTAVPLEPGEDDEPKYYEVRIEKKSAPDKKDVVPPKKEENKSSAASSPRSSVRPDRASAAPSTNNTMPTTEKNEAKTMPNTENKKAMPSENVSAMAPKASAPKTFKLVLGKKQYTSTQEGAMTDKALDVAPMISKGRVMLSARAISGLLGLTTQYNPATKTAIFSDEANNRIELPLGKDYLLVNGEKMMLTSLPVNQQGRVLLPITDIQKAFKKLGTQAEITWNKEDKSILIQK